jgi:cell cycle sensor histidine kinase DivJ
MSTSVDIRSFQKYLDPMLHEAAFGDSAIKSQHTDFMLTHLGAGMLALTALPLHVALIGPPTWFAAVAIMLLAMCLPVAMLASSSGKLELPYMFSSVCFASFISWVAMHSGGLASPVLAWLLVVPLEASFSRSRKVVGFAFASAVLAVLAIVVIGAPISAKVIVEPGAGMQAILLISGLVYSGMVAYRAYNLFDEFGQKTNSALAESNDYANLMSDVVIKFDDNSRIIEVSPSLSRVFGLNASQIAGNGLFERVHVADRPAYLNLLFDARQSKEPQSMELRLRMDREDTQSHHYSWVELSFHKASQHAETTLVGLIKDISDRKANEDHLLEAKTGAELANHAKSRFLANMSHELRTPLNAIIGFADILDQEVFGSLENDRQRDYVRLIRESGGHLLQLVNDILDMSKIETGHFNVVPEPFDVGSVVQSCFDLTRHSADKTDITMELEFAENLPELNADKRALKQILINILSNGIKFSETGDTVKLTVKKMGRFMVFQVVDNGIGIEPEHLPHLGKPFYQADTNYDRRHQGSGLGLSVVRGLCDLHDGRMDIESTPSIGTKVTIALPIDGPKPDLARDQEPTKLALPVSSAGQKALPAPKGTDKKSAVA